MSHSQEPENTLIDARGLACPQPLLRARSALRDRPVGFRITVLATDPHAGVDLRAFCLRAGHTLVSEEHYGPELRFVIERG